MEGCETHNKVAVIERHSARYGVPGSIHIYRQWNSIESVEAFLYELRDIHAQVQDSLGIRVKVSTAKAHSERGRVE